MIRGRKLYARVFWSLIPGWAVPWSDPCEDPHVSVSVDGVHVDAGIVVLVRYLWRNGIRTHCSCQGDPHLYKLHASRHPAMWAPAVANPYSASLTLDSLDDARAVVRVLAPPSEHAATISARGGVSPEEWWFVHFEPSLLARWHRRGDVSANEVVMNPKCDG